MRRLRGACGIPSTFDLSLNSVPNPLIIGAQKNRVYHKNKHCVLTRQTNPFYVTVPQNGSYSKHKKSRVPSSLFPPRQFFPGSVFANCKRLIFICMIIKVFFFILERMRRKGQIWSRKKCLFLKLKQIIYGKKIMRKNYIIYIGG